MVQLLREKRGRPLKHENGWEGVNRQMLWRDVREELGLINDDALAKYLIGLHMETNTEPVLSKFFKHFKTVCNTRPSCLVLVLLK